MSIFRFTRQFSSTVNVPPALIKQLREMTGAGLVDCKTVLVSTGNDLAAAEKILREKGKAKAGRRAEKSTANGIVALAADGNTAVVLEANAETDFTAKMKEFVDIALGAAQRILGSSGAASEALTSATPRDTSVAASWALNRSRAANITLASVPLDTLRALPSSSNNKTYAELLGELSAQTGENMQFRRAIVVSGGTIGFYVHSAHPDCGDAGKIGAAVSISAKDGGAWTGDQDTANQIAMHIAAMSPLSIDIADLDASLVDAERSVHMTNALSEGKTEKLAQNIANGKLRKFFEETVLNEQPFCLSDGVSKPKKISEMIGSHAVINAFVRFKVGEGIKVATEDFADQVQKELQKASR